MSSTDDSQNASSDLSIEMLFHAILTPILVVLLDCKEPSQLKYTLGRVNPEIRDAVKQHNVPDNVPFLLAVIEGTDRNLFVYANSNTGDDFLDFSSLFVNLIASLVRMVTVDRATSNIIPVGKPSAKATYN